MAKKLTSAQISANAAKKTWTQGNLYNLATASAAKNGGTPPPGVPVPQFDPASVPGYTTGVGAVDKGVSDLETQTGVTFDQNGVPVYNGGQYLAGAQRFGVDENGNLITNPNDPRYNPFSVANELKQNFDNRKSATLNGYASRGQLYSGALLNEQNYDANSYAQASDANTRNAHDYYGNLVNNVRNAIDSGGVTKSGLYGNALSTYTTQHANDPAPTLTPNISGPKKVAQPKAPRLNWKSWGRPMHP